VWDLGCILLAYGVVLDLNQGWNLTVDGGLDLMMAQDLKTWNEFSLCGFIMYNLDLNTSEFIIL